jgi:hypothetical protein
MQAVIVIIACIIPFSVVGLSLLYNIRKLKQRAEGWSLVATELGYQYEGERPFSSLPSAIPSFAIFGNGHSKKIMNSIEGVESENTIIIYDYKYTTGSGKNSTTHRQTVALTECKNFHLPTFSIRPEHSWSWLVELFGAQDIDFDEDPDFSRAYTLSGHDETEVRDFFDSARRSAMVERMDSKPTIEGNKSWLCYCPSRYVEPLEAGHLLKEVLDLIKIFESR